jgi:YggT family protein
MAVGNALVAAFLEVVYMILDFFVWALIVGAILSWLIVLGIVDPYNRFVRLANDMLTRITEPLLRPLRRVIPPLGNLDLAPLALIFIIYFLQSFIRHLVF